MIEWSGPVHDVFSPIYIRTEKRLERKLIGSYAQRKALKSLNAAAAAYDNGVGEWPAVSVALRIKCVENFTHKMLKQKDFVVKLLMWEIEWYQLLKPPVIYQCLWNKEEAFHGGR